MHAYLKTHSTDINTMCIHWKAFRTEILGYLKPNLTHVYSNGNLCNEVLLAGLRVLYRNLSYLSFKEA